MSSIVTNGTKCNGCGRAIPFTRVRCAACTRPRRRKAGGPCFDCDHWTARAPSPDGRRRCWACDQAAQAAGRRAAKDRRPAPAPPPPPVHCPAFRAECALCGGRLHASNRSGVCAACRGRHSCPKCGRPSAVRPCPHCAAVAACLKSFERGASAADRPPWWGGHLERLAERAARQEPLSGGGVLPAGSAGAGRAESGES